MVQDVTATAVTIWHWSPHELFEMPLDRLCWLLDTVHAAMERVKRDGR
jgi:hypothetical protein